TPAAPAPAPAPLTPMPVEPFGGPRAAPPPPAPLAPARQAAQPAPAPPAEPVDDRPRTGEWILVGVGAGILAVSHLVPVAIAAGSDFADEGHWVVLPVLGPFSYLGERQGCSDGVDEVVGAFCDS